MKNLLATTAMTIALTVGAAHAQTDTTDPALPPETSAPDATMDGTATDGTTMDSMTDGTDAGVVGTADTDARLTVSPPEGYAEQDVVLTTDNLEGATVYDVDGDDIGDVHGLIFANGTSTFGDDAADDAAEISHAILDIGGWLGIGQHRVAIPLSDLVIYVNNDDAEDVRIYLPRTLEQLEALPEFDENAPLTVQ